MKKIANIEKSIKIGSQKEELFTKVVASTDFTKCQNSLQCVRRFWDALWPTMERLTVDNEIFMEDQTSMLKRYAEIDEKYKLLVIEHEKLEKKLENIENSSGRCI